MPQLGDFTMQLGQEVIGGLVGMGMQKFQDKRTMNMQRKLQDLEMVYVKDIDGV